MGTRADFYTGDSAHPGELKYLGSIGCDGYPAGVDSICLAKSLPDYLERIRERFLEDDASLPERDGWPWPWEDSRTTDYTYCFDVAKNSVLASCFGGPWFDPEPFCDPEYAYEVEPPSDPKLDFPSMKAIQKVTFGKRSGLIVIGVNHAQP